MFVFTVASVSPGRKGGELASAVHAYTKTGDPSMRSLVQHILSLVSHPVLSFLYRWIYDGELEDTHHEVRRRLLKAAGCRAHPKVRRACRVSEQPGAGRTHGLGLWCLRAAGCWAHPRARLLGISLEQRGAGRTHGPACPPDTASSRAMCAWWEMVLPVTQEPGPCPCFSARWWQSWGLGVLRPGLSWRQALCVLMLRMVTGQLSQAIYMCICILHVETLLILLESSIFV